MIEALIITELHGALIHSYFDYHGNRQLRIHLKICAISHTLSKEMVW